MRFRELKKQTKPAMDESRSVYKFATYAERVKAVITDMFMIYVPILYLITYVVMNGKDDFQSSQFAPLIGVSIYGFIYAILTSKFGQTIGKKAYIIKVVDARTGKNISFLRALLRFVAFLFTATTLLGLFLPFYRKDKKALHDLICSTVVINIEP